MADEQQLRRLFDSVKADGGKEWNEWREENPNITIDFKEAYFKHVNLQGVDLLGVDLEGALLRGVNLRDAKITIEQLSLCRNIDGVRYLSAEFLSKIKKKNPELMEWWDENMVKDIQKLSFKTDDEGWTGDWVKEEVKEEVKGEEEEEEVKEEVKSEEEEE